MRIPSIARLLGAATLAIASAAGAQARAGADSTNGALVPGDTAASAALARIVETTRSNGLPVDPILAKVQYGVRIAHAAPARIVASAHAIASRLEVARTALAPASPTDIMAGADALGSGATRDALRAVRAASGGSPVATPLGVLAQLLETSVPVERATEIVTSMMRRGATADQLMALGNSVSDDVHRGAAALAALDARARFLSGVLAPLGAQAAATADAFIQAYGGKPRKP